MGGGGASGSKDAAWGQLGEAGGPRGLRASVAAPNPAFDLGMRAPRALAAGGKAWCEGLGWTLSHRRAQAAGEFACRAAPLGGKEPLLQGPLHKPQRVTQ